MYALSDFLRLKAIKTMRTSKIIPMQIATPTPIHLPFSELGMGAGFGLVKGPRKGIGELSSGAAQRSAKPNTASPRCLATAATVRHASFAKL